MSNQLKVIYMNLEEALGMCACRAYLGSSLAYYDVAAVAAFPYLYA